MTELLLYASARAQLVKENIKPALEAGQAVIADRFVDSSAVYQGIGRGLGVDTVYKAAVRTDTIRIPVAAERKVPLWKRMIEKIADELWNLTKTLGLIGLLIAAVAWRVDG